MSDLEKSRLIKSKTVFSVLNQNFVVQCRMLYLYLMSYKMQPNFSRFSKKSIFSTISIDLTRIFYKCIYASHEFGTFFLSASPEIALGHARNIFSSLLQIYDKKCLILLIKNLVSEIRHTFQIVN